jgi:hypothetical protein
MIPVLGVSTTCLASGLVDPVCQGVSGIGSSIVGSGVTAIFDSMATWVAGGSTWLLQQIGSVLIDSTRVSLSSPWFLTRYRATEAILGSLALPLLLVAALQALFRQQPSILLRAALVQLPLAMIFAGSAVELCSLAISATDELSSAMSAGSPHAIPDLMTSLADILTSSSAISGSSVPTFVALLAALVVGVAALCLWIELVMRTAAIYVAVAFIPLVLISMIWPSLASWTRRLVETLFALIVSKLVVVGVLQLAVGALGDVRNQGFSTLVTGIGLLLLAAFAPFSILRLLPLFESSAATSLEGLRQRSVNSALHGAPRQTAMMASSFVSGTSALTAPLPALSSQFTSMALRAPGGEQSTSDPMAESAIYRAQPRQDPPQQRVVRSVESSGVRDQSRSSTAPNVPRRPSLVIERDAIGPKIRPRR